MRPGVLLFVPGLTGVEAAGIEPAAAAVLRSRGAGEGLDFRTTSGHGAARPPIAGKRS